LFARYAPQLRAVVRRFNGARQPVSPWRRDLRVTHAQVIAERRNAAIRMSTLNQDRKLQSMRAFSGVPNECSSFLASATTHRTPCYGSSTPVLQIADGLGCRPRSQINAISPGRYTSRIPI
jgi:hypothetical protein